MRRPRRAVFRSALGVALAVGVFAAVLPRIASYRSVGNQLATVSAPWAAGLAAGAALDVITTALPWRALLPQLSWRSALGFTQASTALTTVLPGGAPLGMAISFGLLRRLRVSAGAAGFAVALTGIWDPSGNRKVKLRGFVGEGVSQVGAGFDALYDFRPNRRFYGIGNFADSRVTYFRRQVNLGDVYAFAGKDPMRRVRVTLGISDVSVGRGSSAG